MLCGSIVDCGVIAVITSIPYLVRPFLVAFISNIILSLFVTRPGFAWDLRKQKTKTKNTLFISVNIAQSEDATQEARTSNITFACRWGRESQGFHTHLCVLRNSPEVSVRLYILHALLAFRFLQPVCALRWFLYQNHPSNYWGETVNHQFVASLGQCPESNKSWIRSDKKEMSTLEKVSSCRGTDKYV